MILICLNFKMIFGIFRLGFITSFLSSAVIDALIAASAIFVVTSQIPSCLGVSVDKAEGVGLVVKVSFYRELIIR